jgi:ribonucleoside-diphosphate reductase alpha chain
VQAPYEEITAAEYDKLIAELPDIDYASYLEFDDNTTSSQEMACTAGVCEI